MSEYSRAYAKGYNAGMRNYWPNCLPQLPPDEIIQSLIVSAKNLRDMVDSTLATFPEDDPLRDNLDPSIEAVDDALNSLKDWVKREIEQATKP